MTGSTVAASRPEDEPDPTGAPDAPADRDDAGTNDTQPSPFDAVLSMASRVGMAVLATDAGRVVCLPEARYEALRGGTDDTGRNNRVSLTPRETEILGRVARGDAMATISADLGVAANTVAQHLVAVRRKYGVRSTTLAVQAARADGHL